MATYSAMQILHPKLLNLRFDTNRLLTPLRPESNLKSSTGIYKLNSHSVAQKGSWINKSCDSEIFNNETFERTKTTSNSPKTAKVTVKHVKRQFKPSRFDFAIGLPSTPGASLRYSNRKHEKVNIDKWFFKSYGDPSISITPLNPIVNPQRTYFQTRKRRSVLSKYGEFNGKSFRLSKSSKKSATKDINPNCFSLLSDIQKIYRIPLAEQDAKSLPIAEKLAPSNIHVLPKKNL